jgi:F0F1-type ATP synthase assembly protein I
LLVTAAATLLPPKARFFVGTVRKMAANSKKQLNLWAQVGFYSSLGFILPAGAAAGCAAGWLLDRCLHTSPLLTVLLAFLGAAAGIIELLRILKRAEKDAGGND